MNFDTLAQNPTFWVLISFVLFLALILKLKVPTAIGKALDARAEKISKQLDEARTLKEEAQALLANYQRKQRDAKKEAEAMVEQSRENAELLAKDAEAKLDGVIERQTKAAEEKIAQAQAAAVKEVQEVAVHVAVNAARKIIESELKGAKADQLIEGAVKDVESRLN